MEDCPIQTDEDKINYTKFMTLFNKFADLDKQHEQNLPVKGGNGEGRPPNNQVDSISISTFATVIQQLFTRKCNKIMPVDNEFTNLFTTIDELKNVNTNDFNNVLMALISYIPHSDISSIASLSQESNAIVSAYVSQKNDVSKILENHQNYIIKQFFINLCNYTDLTTSISNISMEVGRIDPQTGTIKKPVTIEISYLGHDQLYIYIRQPIIAFHVFNIYRKRFDELKNIDELTSEVKTNIIKGNFAITKFVSIYNPTRFPQLGKPANFIAQYIFRKKIRSYLQEIVKDPKDKAILERLLKKVPGPSEQIQQIEQPQENQTHANQTQENQRQERVRIPPIEKDWQKEYLTEKDIKNIFTYIDENYGKYEEERKKIEKNTLKHMVFQYLLVGLGTWNLEHDVSDKTIEQSVNNVYREFFHPKYLLQDADTIAQWEDEHGTVYPGVGGSIIRRGKTNLLFTGKRNTKFLLINGKYKKISSLI